MIGWIISPRPFDAKILFFIVDIVHVTWQRISGKGLSSYYGNWRI